jgi:radical S-adenosyl methionine domain-containing protein 2
MDTTNAPRERCPISTVNFHLWKPCNMRCRYCFAHFDDAGHDNLSRDDALAVVRELARGFERITFVGGEPTLCPWLLELIDAARSAGLGTSVVTNGWRLAEDAPYAAALLSRLDWLGLSVDSDETATNLKVGRSVGRRTIPTAELVRIAALARRYGLGLKVNTVVTRANAEQDLRGMILDLRPDRWKLFQALPVRGQNDAGFRELAVSSHEFWAFVNRHRELEDAGVVVVPEDHEALTGSYAMVDPGGYAFDNTQGAYRYSDAPVHQIGWSAAFRQLLLDSERFVKRGGIYTLKGNRK